MKNLSDCRVLLVDDAKTNLDILVEGLKADHKLSLALNGEEGLAVAARENPDLILLDYNMPVMDGIAMFRKMREDPGLKRTPVIMLTANSGLQSLATVARLGVRDYVTKPFREEELLAKVGRIIPLILRAETATASDAEPSQPI